MHDACFCSETQSFLPLTVTSCIAVCYRYKLFEPITAYIQYMTAAGVEIQYAYVQDLQQVW